MKTLRYFLFVVCFISVVFLLIFKDRGGQIKNYFSPPREMIHEPITQEAP